MLWLNTIWRKLLVKDLVIFAMIAACNEWIAIFVSSTRAADGYC